MDQIKIALNEFGQGEYIVNVPDLNPAIILIGRNFGNGNTVEVYEGKVVPHPIEGYLPSPVVLAGFPFESLIVLDPTEGMFDLLVYNNGGFTYATGEGSENKWFSPDGNVPLYYGHKDLRQAQLPLTRYGGESSLELNVVLSSNVQQEPEQVITHYIVDLPSDIEGFTESVTSVRFPRKWDSNGTFCGDNLVIVSTADSTYTVTAQYLSQPECIILEQMFYTALHNTEDLGQRGQISKWFCNLKNYM